MPEPTPHRRWFQFSLRGLFIFMTLLCVWLGWSMHWIRQRRAFLSEHSFDIWCNLDDRGQSGPSTVRAPGLLWLLGEPGVRSMDSYSTDPELWERAATLFPEATVERLTPFTQLGPPD